MPPCPINVQHLCRCINTCREVLWQLFDQGRPKEFYSQWVRMAAGDGLNTWRNIYHVEDERTPLISIAWLVGQKVWLQINLFRKQLWSACNVLVDTLEGQDQQHRMFWQYVILTCISCTLQLVNPALCMIPVSCIMQLKLTKIPSLILQRVSSSYNNFFYLNSVNKS